MENIKTKTSLDNSISKVLNSNTIKDNKSCKNCGENDKTKNEKNCSTCNPALKKVTPIVITSTFFLFFAIYGVISSIVDLINLFTQ